MWKVFATDDQVWFSFYALMVFFFTFEFSLFKWKLFNGLPYIRGFQVGAKIDKWSWMSTGSSIDLTYYAENVAQMKNCHKIRKNKQFCGFWFDGTLCRFKSSFLAFSYVWLFAVFFVIFYVFLYVLVYFSIIVNSHLFETIHGEHCLKTKNWHFQW